MQAAVPRRDYEREYYATVMNVRRKFVNQGKDVVEKMVEGIDPRDFIIPQLEDITRDMENLKLDMLPLTEFPDIGPDVPDEGYTGYLLMQFIDPPALSWDQVHSMMRVLTTADLFEYMEFWHATDFVDIEHSSSPAIINHMRSIIDDSTALTDYAFGTVQAHTANNDPNNAYFDFGQFLFAMKARAGTNEDTRIQRIVRGFLYTLRHGQLVTMRRLARAFHW